VTATGRLLGDLSTDIGADLDSELSADVQNG